MTVKSRKELNRAVLVGGVFILIMTGVAFTVGSLSNAYFAQNGPIFRGTVLKSIDEQKGHAILHLAQKTDGGAWQSLYAEDGTTPKAVPVVLDAGQPYLNESLGEKPIAQGRSISIVYAKGSSDQIIPTYITSAMPKWFGLLFLLTLLAAAMSTLSSQFHTLGTSIGRDVYEQVTGAHGHSVLVTRIGIIVGIVLAVIISYYARGGYIIARATAIFFGLCGSAFLPAYVGGLFFRRINKPGAIASMIVGFSVSAFWLLFIKAKEAGAIGLVQKLAGGKPSLLADSPNWPVVDPILIAMPLAIITAVVVTALTKPMDPAHIDYCFGGVKPVEE